MIGCNNCGAEQLKWKWDTLNGKYALYEIEGDVHICRTEDVERTRRRTQEFIDAKREAIRKHREDNGYL